MAGLYLHIPFCKQACYYCDFHFSTDRHGRQELCQAMAHELILQKGYVSEPFTTIYLGGGTPSLLTSEEVDLLLTATQKDLILNPGEITLEANPDDLTEAKSRDLLAAGVNRLSIGIQSFDNTVLRFLNRAHTSEASYQCLEDVRTAGFDNVSIDLIYSIPGLSENLWAQTLREVIRFSPEHISAYALTIEERTVFGNWKKRGKLRSMDEEGAARQFEILMDTLGEAGYEQYEISNFSKPGFCSKHNSNYWNQSHYLGIGPSAHSYNGDTRQFNVRNNALYVRSIQQGIIPFQSEILSPQNKINEYIITSLRTKWGCNLNILRNQLNDDLLHRSGDYIAQLEQGGLVTLVENTLRLTRKGKLLADTISEDLMISA